jgi:formylglycine-generating enzyme required for sulfatase activity
MGGTYDRTYNTSFSTSGPPAGGWTDLADPATVSNFRLDKYLVTVGRFRQFVTAWNNGSGWMPAPGSGTHAYLPGGGLENTGGGTETGWDATDWNNTTDIDPTSENLACDSNYPTWTPSAGSQENLPINCVTWYEAYAFCIWDGGFLPSEAEWEYAAAGGGGSNGQREYPWGSTVPGTACPGSGCEYAIYDCEYPNGSGNCAGVSNIAPVGTASLGAGAWGQLDLAGELFEWNLDWYEPYVDPCMNCANLTTASSRVIRGGIFFFGASHLLPPYRLLSPARRLYYVGFRCARTP